MAKASLGKSLTKFVSLSPDEAQRSAREQRIDYGGGAKQALPEVLKPLSCNSRAPTIMDGCKTFPVAVTPKYRARRIPQRTVDIARTAGRAPRKGRGHGFLSSMAAAQPAG